MCFLILRLSFWHIKHFIVLLTILSTYCILQYYCSEPDILGTNFVRNEYALKPLIDAEEALYGILKDVYNSRDGKAIRFEAVRYFEDVEDNAGYNLNRMHAGAISGTAKYSRISGSPILCYRLIYRYVNHIPTIYEVGVDEIEGFEQMLQGIRRKFESEVALPVQKDLDDASEDILRLLHFYDLEVEEFAQGKILGQDTGFALQAKHCLEIAKYAYKSKSYLHLAVELFEYAETLTGRPPGSFLSRSALLKDLELAIRLHDEEWERQPKYEEQFFVQQINHSERSSDYDVISKSGLTRRPKRRTGLYEFYKGQVNGSQFNEINFWGLCSGDDLLPESEKSKLHCWYESKSNPAWYINPLKIELLASDPHIIQIYEFLGDKLVEKLIAQMQVPPKMGKSMVYIGKLYSRRRTSSSKWIDSNQSESLIVSKRIEYLTGLRVAGSSEKLQLATYSFGQHYVSHRDTLGDTLEILDDIQVQKGERIATVMIYLAAPELGGQTAFTEAQVVARPLKGSAVFWYNLKRNGTVEMKTSHGACPVLIGGNKIVVNKWIRSNDQFLRRPCSLDPDQ